VQYSNSHASGKSRPNGEVPMPQSGEVSTVAVSLDSSSDGSLEQSRSTTELKVSAVAVSLDSSSDGSVEQARSTAELIAWDEFPFGRQIQPHRKHAHCADDIHLLSCFLELIQLPDVGGDTVKLLLRAIKLLRLCDYSVEDICSILAHASAYFPDAYALCGSHMDANEVGNVLVTLIFVAHCYVQDETCPLHVWQQHLFRKYCPVKTLNAAIIRLLEIRCYVLRLESQDLDYRFTRLLQKVQRRRIPATHDAEVEGASQSRGNAFLTKVLDTLNYR